MQLGDQFRTVQGISPPIISMFFSFINLITLGINFYNNGIETM